MSIPYLWAHGADPFQNGSFSPIIFKNLILLTFFFFNALITSGHGVLVGRLRSVKALDESNKGGDAGQQHS